MSQFNINLTPEFEDDLKAFMEAKKIDKKSEALRLALRERVKELKKDSRGLNYQSWIGLGLKAPLQPKTKRKFKNNSII